VSRFSEPPAVSASDGLIVRTGHVNDSGTAGAWRAVAGFSVTLHLAPQEDGLTRQVAMLQFLLARSMTNDRSLQLPIVARPGDPLRLGILRAAHGTTGKNARVAVREDAATLRLARTPTLAAATSRPITTARRSTAR